MAKDQTQMEPHQEAAAIVAEETPKTDDAAPVLGGVTEETPKNQRNEDGDITINIDNPVADGVQETETETNEEPQDQTHEEEAPKEEVAEIAPPVLEKITDEENNTDEGGVAGQPEASNSASEPQEIQAQNQTQELPEGVDKLIQFIEETGGTVNDWMRLNLDIDSVDDTTLVREYYKSKYPSNSEDRLNRRIQKDFSYNEESDDADLIQDKKDLFEDTVFEAKKHLEEQKGKYYAELKSRRQSQLPESAQEAISYFEEQKQLSEQNQQLTKVFLDRTDKLFNDDFKGFDFKVGDDKFRFKVNDVAKVKEHQSDLMNFVTKFVGEDGTITDPAGYHKAIFVANNADLLAQHFYEMGKAEGIQEVGKSANNIDMGSRQDHGNNVGSAPKTTARVVDGSGSSGNKLKINWTPKSK